MVRRSEILALRVEGVGDGESGQALRLATGAPAGDAAGVYEVCLDADALPAELGGRADWRAGEAAVSGLEVRLRATPRALRALYPGRGPVRAGELTQDLPRDPLATGYDLLYLRQDDPDTSLVGYTLAVGRELVYLEGYVSDADGEWIYGVARGRCDTAVAWHGAGAREDREVFLTGDLPDGALARELVAPALRRVALLQLYPHQGYADERIVRYYALRGVSMPDLTHLTLHLDSALELVRARRLCASPWRGRRTSTPREGEADPEARYEGAGTPSSGAGVAGGGQCLLSVGGQTVARAGWVAPRRGPTSVGLRALAPVLPGAPPYHPEAQDEDEVWECYSSSDEAPPLNDGGGAHNARLASHVIDLAQQLLTTTGNVEAWGGPGPNGDYDLGVEELGCAVPVSLLDLDSFDAARAEIGGDPVQTANHLGVDGAPIDALSYIQGKLAPYGYLLVTGPTGLLSLRRYGSSARGDELTVTLRDFDGEPAQERRLFDPYDRAALSWDDRPGLGPRRATVNDAVRLRRQLASAQEAPLDLSGIRDEQQARSQAVTVIQRWREEVSQWTLPLRGSDAILRLREGDKVLVTHPGLVTAPGRQGAVEALCLITEATIDLAARTARLTVLWVGQRLRRSGRISMAATVSDFTGAAVEIEPNDYSATPRPGQTDDTFEAAAGYLAQAITPDGETARAPQAVASVSGTGPTITLGAAISGLTVGDVLELAPYDTPQVQAAKDRFAFWGAPDAPYRPGDSDDDPPYQWGD